jgi:hypothetical protein
MADTKTVIIQQMVHRPHNETVVRRWYDVVERTITRELHPDGSIAAEEIDEEVTETQVDLEEETLEMDVDVDDDELVQESLADEA